MLQPHYRRKLSEETEVNLMPFINFLVVLIPVLMLSAEFSQINILDACPVRGGAQETPSSEQTAPTELAICISDSAITVATDERILGSFGCTAHFFPESVLGSALGSLRAGLPAGMNRITIASDIAVKYQRVIDVMDLARKHGFDDIAITKLRG